MGMFLKIRYKILIKSRNSKKNTFKCTTEFKLIEKLVCKHTILQTK